MDTFGLAIDTECTTIEKGHPFTPQNKLVAVSLFDGGSGECLKIENKEELPFGEFLHYLQQKLDRTDILIGFNIKRDLHWLRRYGISIPEKTTIWDVQIVHFILTQQRNRYPSLDDVCEYYGLETKLDHIKENYWDKGIDTLDIPWEELSEYAIKDAELTYRCFEKQNEEASNKMSLIWTANKDLLVLEEMEYNGIYYDTKKSLEIGDQILDKIAEIDRAIHSFARGVPVNWDSPEHCSSVIYGGTIVVKRSEPYAHVYKTGKKAGTTAIRYHHFEDSYEFPRLVVPPPKSKLAKAGLYSTDEKTLEIAKISAKGKGKELITLLLERRKLAKKVHTYYHGFPQLYETMGWRDNLFHGQLNQCTAITGRLSSNNPNLQNIDGAVQDCVKSRFT